MVLRRRYGSSYRSRFRRSGASFGYRKSYGRSYKSFRKPSASYSRYRTFGNKTRAYLKYKGTKLQTCSHFVNILSAHNDAANGILFTQSARTSWFGSRYDPNAVMPQGVQPGVLDPNTQNPTDNGNGMLNEVNLRCPNIDFTSMSYSALTVTAGDIITAWNRLNPHIDVRRVYFKAVKLTAVSADLTRTHMFFVRTASMAAGDPAKFRESIGSARAYIKTRPLANQGLGNAQWTIPEVVLGGPVNARVKLKLYYKMKKLANQ